MNPDELEVSDDPEVEAWTIKQIELRRDYLLMLRQRGYDRPPKELPDIEEEIRLRKELLANSTSIKSFDRSTPCSQGRSSNL